MDLGDKLNWRDHIKKKMQTHIPEDVGFNRLLGKNSKIVLYNFIT